MQIEYFREKYYEEYGSVFHHESSSLIHIAEDMDFFNISTPEEVISNLADFKEDEGFKYFLECLQRADHVLIYGRDGVRPGDTVNIYQIIMEV
jgi:hypothetical protein